MNDRPLDLVPLFSSDLHLRWTTGGLVLDEETLGTIEVLAPASAARVFREHTQRVRALHIHRRVPSCEILHLSSVRSQQVASWITKILGKGMAPGHTDRILVSWDEERAVRTHWTTFQSHWLSFCREGHDDTIITPLVGDWVLAHHHEGRLFLGN